MVFLKRIGDKMKNLKKQIIINVLIIVIAVVLFKGVSYSLDTSPTSDNKNLLIKSGNMQVVLNIPNEKYELLDSSKAITSDILGIKEKGYSFTITNTGNIPIEYYEVRLVNQEGKVSTLPHKYLRFTINKDNNGYENVKNLGDNDSILSYGYNLDVGKSHKYDLKMWISDSEFDALGKELYGAIEVTLYQKYDVYKSYVLYESANSTNVPIRTSIYSPISLTIPTKTGYKFLGWQKGEMIYKPGDTFRESIGTTLTAIWEKEKSN